MPGPELKDLFENNKKWAGEITKRDPTFFKRLSHLQSPKYLWIGCSDSRVPANQITGLLPGELFVHRNVANIVVHTDLNCLSVLQFAVEILEVRHVIICGHYGCGGVEAAFHSKKLGLIDNWLRHIQDIRTKYSHELNQIKDETACLKRLCELNVLEQAQNVCQTTIVQDARNKKKALSVHALIYDIHDGLLKQLWSSK
ncbi:MAG: carbonate dehydratase [Candidatus Omnitrophota bacterium]|nr:carbonate dehydratase [Candidatus Omnitrophota bacterium]